MCRRTQWPLLTLLRLSPPMFTFLREGTLHPVLNFSMQTYIDPNKKCKKIINKSGVSTF